MPKKKLGFGANVIHIRIDEEEKKIINKFLEKHKNDFESNSHFIRTAIAFYIENSGKKEELNIEEKLKNEIILNKQKIDELLLVQKRILELIDKKSEESENDENNEIKGYQQELILNLLYEKPRDEIEISKLLDIDEIDVLRFINKLLKLGKIKQNGTKYSIAH